MSFCANCGQKLPEQPTAIKFCPACGEKVYPATTADSAPAAPAPAPVPKPISNPTPAPVASRPTPPPVVLPDQPSKAMHNPTLSCLKEIASSPLMMFFAIVYSVLLLVSLFWQDSSMSALLGDTDLLGDLNLSLSDDTWFSSLIDGSTLLTIISNTPTIIILIGIWITFGSAHGNNPMRNDAGLKMIKVVCQIKRIMWPIICSLITILLMSSCSKLNSEINNAYGYASSSAADSVNRIFFLVFFVMWGICICQVIYLSKLIDSLSVLSDAMHYGKPCGGVSIFLIVLWFISAHSCFSCLLIVDGMFIPLVLQGLMYILAACLFIQLRSRLDAITRMQTQHSPMWGRQWRCNICGRSNNATTAICFCGHPRGSDRVWVCSNCNSSNPAAAISCSNCGRYRTRTF